MSSIDKEILQRFAIPAEREAAFRMLVDTYSERLYYQIRRLVETHDDTDDVLQNVLVKAWRYLDGFNGEAALYTWLYRIAYNESMTFLKQRNKRSTGSIDDMQEGSTTEAYMPAEDIEERLQQAIDILPEKQKLVFHMRYYDELPYEEMSQVLGTSVGALKASYHHAVKKIEAHLTGH